MVSKKIKMSLMDLLKTEKIVTRAAVERAVLARWRVEPYDGAVPAVIALCVKAKVLQKVGHGMYSLRCALPTAREVAEFNDPLASHALAYLGHRFPRHRTTDQMCADAGWVDRDVVERKLRELKHQGALIKVGHAWKLALAFATPEEISANPLTSSAPAPAVDIFS